MEAREPTEVAVRRPGGTRPTAAELHAGIAAALEALDADAELVYARSGDLVIDSRRARGGRWAPFSIRAASANRKLAPVRSETARSGRTRFVPIGPFVASTFASIRGTCPDSCPFLDGGCFVQAGASHLTMGRLDRAARGMTALQVTRAEATGLRRLWVRGVPQDGARGGRDLRIHVGGDVSCTRGARELADAVDGLRARGLGDAWTYTHRWRTIDKRAWGPIAALASVETPDEARQASRQGYAPALTVETFRDGHQSWRIGGGLTVVPCPFEAHPRQPTCVECRLCLDPQLADRKVAIAFATHGEGRVVAADRIRSKQRRP